MTENTLFHFNDDTRQEDTSEWIDALYETIEGLLDDNIDMQTYWCNLFKWNSTITYEYCNNSNHKSEEMTTNRIL